MVKPAAETLGKFSGGIMKKLVITAVLFLMPLFSGAADGPGPYLIGHITTCSGLINNYPADSTNWFYKNKHKVVQYFVYFLFRTGGQAARTGNRYYNFVNPFEYYSGASRYYDEENFVFENKWVSPSGRVICEQVVSWNRYDTEKNVRVDNKQYVPYAFANYIGIKDLYTENGQTGLPKEKGLYHINLYVNGDLAAVTFFEIKD